MKPLYNLLGLLILLVTPLGAQQSVSNYVGFEVERVRANTITLIGITPLTNSEENKVEQYLIYLGSTMMQD